MGLTVINDYASMILHGGLVSLVKRTRECNETTLRGSGLID
jgi:hypothetical protein